MDRRGMFDRVRMVIAEEIGRDDQITPEARFEDLDIDSLDSLEIRLSIEDEFAVEIPEPEWRKVQTVGDILGVLDRALARPAA